MESRIIAEKVCKQYRPTSKGRSARQHAWALHDVSFSVAPGEMFGVVGANGAGKSTLLRLLGGVGRPSTGSIRVAGRIGALLDLAGGFLGDLTGRENAVLAGVVAGLLKREIEARMDQIVAFAELEEFIDEPVRTYSTGMMMRLAFSVAVHTDPEVLLVDEFLSVGDLAFQAKCHARIRALRDGGCAIVMVSHGMEQVRQLCDRVLWLRSGEVAALGTAEVVAGLYETEMREETLRRTPDGPKRTSGGLDLVPRENRFGTFEVELDSVVFHPGDMIFSGDALGVTLCYHAKVPVNSPVFAVSISKKDGTPCLDTNTHMARVEVPDLREKGERREIRFEIDRLELAAGNYFLDVGIFESDWKHAYDYHWHAYPFTVEGAPAHKGLLAPPCRWQFGGGKGT
ncbi:ABC transporter ATP-binding protein [Haloferula sp. BvORR071]|uniref:ABC transporter ATP-binding protein n=1 Tax=Haloferula sp. BvORR071 TaxID=1396141 RepID=UPI0005577578|nr:ABC transporter ATP-binding protein [Haloferula sp. BvORR071]